MHYMVYSEHSTGCSSPDDICYADFDELGGAQKYIQKLKDHNLLDEAERRKKCISIYDNHFNIRLCIVLEETVDNG